MGVMGVGAALQPYLFPDLSKTPSLSDFVLSLYIGVILLAIRLACEAITTPLLRNALVKRRNKPNKVVGKVRTAAHPPHLRSTRRGPHTLPVV